MKPDTLGPILGAVGRLNEMRDADSRIEPAAGTVIAGPGATLDSMGLVNLMLFAEEELTREAGQPVDVMSVLGERVTDGSALTLRELADLVGERLVG